MLILTLTLVVVGTTMKSLGWHFSPWAPKYIEMYSQHLDHSFAEVRGSVAENLRHLSELELHPSFSSVEVFLRACRDEPGRLMQAGAEYEAKIDGFAAQLIRLRTLRQPAALGSQSYDRAASTSRFPLPLPPLDRRLLDSSRDLANPVLTWMFTSISDHRIATAYPFIQKLLGEFFRIQEILDNEVRCLPSFEPVGPGV